MPGSMCRRTGGGGYDRLVRDRMNFAGLPRLVAGLEDDPSLMEPGEVRRRIEALDQLDTYFGDYGAAQIPDVQARARALCQRLEAANSAVYETIRARVRDGAGAAELLRWFKRPEGPPSPGPGYDDLDELMSGVLQLREPAHPPAHPAAGMVFYQPTPARHILQLFAATSLSETDVLVDLGSGLGHVPLLASILTGARSVGIELEPAYIASARECAESLGLGRVSFLQQDARDADFSVGTVFFLYTPFTGAVLKTVLGRLEKESANRPFRVCTFGPCTPFVAKERWLRAVTEAEAEQITCFECGR